MKKLFLLLAVILSLQCAMAQDVSFFVKGGIGLSNYIGKDAGYDAKLSYRIGAGLDVHAQNIWGFQTGLYFTESGAKSSLFFETIKLNPWYIEIPLMTRLENFQKTPTCSATLKTGISDSNASIWD